jgi:alkanesulfonate monooxygenase
MPTEMIGPDELVRPTEPAPPVRYHWSLSSVDDPLRRSRAYDSLSGVPDLAQHIAFSRLAERCGIDSLLVAIGSGRPEPYSWATALGRATERIRFLCAVRSGLSTPAYFVQQVNTVSALIGGRICLNVVTGHSRENRIYGDFLEHGERYDRNDEFWTVCHALWRRDGPVTFTGKYYQVEAARLNTPFVCPDRDRPEIFFAGSSARAVTQAAVHADCLFQLAKPPADIAPVAAALAPSGVEVGMQVSMMARPTREEAVRAAVEMVAGLGESSRRVHRELRRGSDSDAYTSVYALADDESYWATPYLWTGAVPVLGAPAGALVGGPAEIADAICQYRGVGVSNFMFVGWPDFETLEFFAQEIMPIVRSREAAAGRSAAPATR